MQIFDSISHIETPVLIRWIGCLPRFKFFKACFRELLFWRLRESAEQMSAIQDSFWTQLIAVINRLQPSLDGTMNVKKDRKKREILLNNAEPMGISC